MNSNFGGSGFNSSSGSGSGKGRKPKKLKKIDGTRAFGKVFACFVLFLFVVVVSFISGFCGSLFNKYLNSDNAGEEDSLKSDNLPRFNFNAVENVDVATLVGKVMPSVVGVVSPCKGLPSDGRFGGGFGGGFPSIPFPFIIPFPFMANSDHKSGFYKEDDFDFCITSKSKIPRNAYTGSGFFVNIDGKKLIVTNYHVIKNNVESGQSGQSTSAEDSIWIVLKNDISNMKRADVVGYDSDLDVALLKLVDYDDSKIGCLEFADIKDIKLGELAIAIGNPISLEYTTVTSGIVSNRHVLKFENGVKVPVVQTDAAINHGNSGGPLINSRGQVMGINTAKPADIKISNVSYAIEGSAIKNSINKISKEGIKNNGASRPSIGVTVFDDDSLFSKFGVVISDVEKGSNGEKAGLKPMDIIVSIDGVLVQSFDDWQKEFNKKEAGSTIRLVISREARKLECSVVVGSSRQSSEDRGGRRVII